LVKVPHTDVCDDRAMSGTIGSAELVLGTAQLGMPYGAANRLGQPSADDAALILRSAVTAGVRWIDTAAAYGSAEQRIGSALPGARRAHVVTKLAPLNEMSEAASTGDIRRAVDESVRRSCARLGTDRLEVLLLHRASHMTARGGAIWNKLKELRDEGVLYDLGVSVYSPEEALAAVDDEDVHHIQLPFNVLDWRWRSIEVIEALHKRRDVTVHARSALLQGLLAADPEAEWPSVEGIDPADLRENLWRLSRELDRDSPADLCLAYVRAHDWIDGVVVGMESLSQLALNLALFKRPPLTSDEIAMVDASLPRATEKLLNPALWAKAA
jgi:spore coat polysaccharide biosynthesis protein SpsF